MSRSRKCCAVIENVAAAGILKRMLVVIHPLDAAAELDRVSAVGPERIVSVLVRIPGVEIVRA